MTTDALKVVYAKDGSHLLISCNRLLGKTKSCMQLSTSLKKNTHFHTIFQANLQLQNALGQHQQPQQRRQQLRQQQPQQRQQQSPQQ